MNNLIQDLSTLTTIPEDALLKLKDKIIWVICDSAESELLSGEGLIKVDLGIGTLLLSISEDDEILYKFIPSANLEDALKETFINKKNPLKLKLEKLLANKIIKTYKDMV